MKSTYAKTGNRPGKPAYRTSAGFIKQFLNKIKKQKLARKEKVFFRLKYFNNKKEK